MSQHLTDGTHNNQHGILPGSGAGSAAISAKGQSVRFSDTGQKNPVRGSRFSAAEWLASVQVRVRWDDGSGENVLGLTEFEALNADGIGPNEVAEIRGAMLKGNAYHGGGGSAPGWSLEVVP